MIHTSPLPLHALPIPPPPTQFFFLLHAGNHNLGGDRELEIVTQGCGKTVDCSMGVNASMSKGWRVTTDLCEVCWHAVSPCSLRHQPQSARMLLDPGDARGPDRGHAVQQSQAKDVADRVKYLPLDTAIGKQRMLENQHENAEEKISSTPSSSSGNQSEKGHRTNKSEIFSKVVNHGVDTEVAICNDWSDNNHILPGEKPVRSGRQKQVLEQDNRRLLMVELYDKCD